METTWNRKMTSAVRGVRMIALVLAVGLTSVSAFAQINGNMASRNSTIPRGAAFLNDTNGGHWWVSDQNLGICELFPQNVPGQPPYTLNFCSAAFVKAGGEIVVGNPVAALNLPPGSKFVYVADDTVNGITVARLVFNPAGNAGNGGFTGATLMKVQNLTVQGGGGGGGKGGGGGGVLGARPLGIALMPRKTPGANNATQDLYVGYIKSADIMRVDSVDGVALNNTAPAVTKIGSTSDGVKGVNALLTFGSDLYLSEAGGFGLSKIADPTGIVRPPCTASTPCAAIPVGATTLPGGLATDWTPGTPTGGKFIFVGDAPLGGAQHSITRYDPSNGSKAIYSLNINPSYTEPDAAGVSTIWTTYTGPMALGYNPATSDLFVGDDPQATAASPIFQQGHFWKISPASIQVPSITSVAPVSGSTLGGDVVTITGTNLAAYDSFTGIVTALPSIAFGPNAAANVACAPAAAPPANPTPSTCTVTSPAGFGVIDVRITITGQTSAVVAGDKFTYIAPGSAAISVTGVSPIRGASIGGTRVTISGQNLATYDVAGNVIGVPDITFGARHATNVICQNATTPVTLPVSSVCTVSSPSASDGSVDVQATLNGQTSGANPADVYTYATASASLYAWGITAPKGGALWIPGALGGHYWTSDHAQGICRQDLASTAPAPFTVAGSSLHAMNWSVCGASLVGSSGQAAYDPTLPGGNLHYIYVPDNAVKSVAVWRLTFDSSTETMVADPIGGAMATAMIPLADVTTLKPNGLALGPDGALYVTDLTEPYVRKITNPGGDPRTQSVSLVAVTGDGRGANGTIGFIGNLLYIPGNRAEQFIDITQCPLPGGAVCGMASVPAPSGVFVAGGTTDAANKKVYLSNSAGAAAASILRYDATFDAYVAFAPGTYPADAFGVVTCTLCTTGNPAVNYIGGGLLPPPGSPDGTVTISLTAQRPWDEENHPTVGVPAGSFVSTGFAFVFGMHVDPAGTLVITEDPSAGARSGRGTMWTVPFLP